jgi:hypothetical protein
MTNSLAILRSIGALSLTATTAMTVPAAEFQPFSWLTASAL